MNNKRDFFNFISKWVIGGLLLGLFSIFLYFNPGLYDNRVTDSGNSGLTPGAAPLSYALAVHRAAPSVVSIHALKEVATPSLSAAETLREKFFGLHSPHGSRKKVEDSLGSGVIFDRRGLILTNYHVIEATDAIIINLSDGRRSPATIVGIDPGTDLAVLKIELTDLPSVAIADINNIQVGDVVLAIGNPYGVGQTVTQGIVSATGREYMKMNTYANFIQTDAAINPGNSGGALVNTLGEIIGINSNIFTKTGSYSGIGFAIPVDLATDVLAQIVEHGRVIRGWLGVEGQEVTSSIMESIGLPVVKGIIVTDIYIDGPAFKGGIKIGDIITQINKQSTEKTRDIVFSIAKMKPGDVVVVHGIRKRQSFMTEVTLGERPVMSN